MWNQSKSDQPKLPQMSSVIWLLVLLILVSLACSLGAEEASQALRIKKLLPTLTPTVIGEGLTTEAAVEPPVAAANNSASAQAPVIEAAPGRVHLPTLTPTPFSTPVVDAIAQAPAQPVDSSSQPEVDSATGSTSGSNPPATNNPAPRPNPPGAYNPAPQSNPPAANNPGPQPTPTATSAPPSSSNPPSQSPLPPSAERPVPVTPNPAPTLPDASPLSGWSFIGVRSSIDQGDAMVVGEMVNYTGEPQTELQVSSVVYNKQERVITSQVDMLDYIPVDFVPPGGRVPFELTIESDEPIFRIDLVGKSIPADVSPIQDFQFSQVNQWIDESDLYCLGGQVQNNAELEDFLIVLMTIYDDKGQVISFGEHAEGSPETVEVGQSTPFEMCIDPLEQPSVHYELSALGL